MWLLLFGLVARAESLHVFLPTEHHNPIPGRSDALRLEFRDLPMSSLSGIVSTSRRVLPAFDASHPPEVVLYLSPKRPIEEQRQILADAKKSLEKAYPGVPITIQTRFIDEDAAMKREAADTEKAIKTAAASMPQDADTKEAEAFLLKANATAATEAETLENGLSKLQQPATVRRLVSRVAIIKALTAIGSRGTQLALAGISGDPMSWLASVGLVASDAARQYYDTKYEMEIGKFLADHKLPLADRMGLQRLQELYTRSESMKLAKGIVGTQAVWGLLLPAFNQTLSHFANPQKFAAPDGSDVARWMVTNTVGSILYYGGFRGLEQLRQKGWISQPTMDLLLRVEGWVSQFGTVLNSTGNPKALEFLPFVLGPVWGSQALQAAAGPLVSPRNRRIVLVDPDVPHRGDLNQLEVLESTLVMPKDKKELKARLDEVAETKRIKPNLIQRIVGGTINGFSSAVVSCAEFLARLRSGKSGTREGS